MSGSFYQAATEISVGERDGLVSVTFRRSGDLSEATDVIYDVTTESATSGVDFTGGSGTVRFEAGQTQASVNFGIINDALSEATETFIVSLVAADNGTISVPRTVRVNILDDENPVLPPVDPPLSSPYDVDTQTVIGGLRQPINFEFSPTDPNIVYIAEKGGLIRTYNIATGANLGVFADLRSTVNEDGDRGLMDIALHPNFPAEPYLYAFYVVDPPGATADATGNRYAHVVRFTADSSAGYLRVVPNSGVIIAGQTGRSTADISGGGTLDYTRPDYVNATSSERTLRANDPNPPLVIDGFKQNYIKVDSSSHAGGSLAFGPDGMLYISTGDGTSFDYADPRTVHVQNLNSMSGKILRVDPMTGQGLTDNPFYQSGQSLDSNISKVYQYGLRNPFSITFDPQGRLFITETGWNAYEEINSGSRGANFGWPYYEGGEAGTLKKTSGYQNASGAAAFYAGVADGTIQVTAPYAAFGHATAVPGYQNQAITGGNVVYTGDKYPAALQNDYFFSNFPLGQAFSIDTNDRTKVTYLFNNTPYAPVFYKQGPDGYVYFADLGDLDNGLSNGRIARLLISDPNANNLLVNGSFESTTIPTGSSNYASILGWTAIAGGRIELWRNNKNTPASNGANLAELDFDTAWDGFYQDVQTVAGQSHTLTFDFRRRADKTVTTPDVEILWNGVVVATATPGNNWGKFTVPNLVGTGGLDRLTIREVQSQSTDGLGALLDNFKLVTAGAVVPAVSISATPSSITEANGANATVTFSLNAVQSSDVTVTYSTVNGTATAGSDFTGKTNATATILAGQTSVTAQVALLNDNVAEPSETFSVNLVGATLNGNAIAASGNATVTIVDDDAPPPSGANLLVNGSFEATTIPTGSSSYASIPGWTALAGSAFELMKAHRTVVASDGANFAELDNDAAWDGFYQDVQTIAGQAHTLTFDLRKRADKPLTTPADVQILWNGVVVATTTPGTNWGSFTVSNLVGTGGLDRLTIREVQSQSADGLGALLDNFKLATAGAVVPAVSVSATPASIAEANGANATVTFTLNAVQANDVTVTYSTANGTATAGSDFTAKTNATATILAGQTSVTAQVALINDDTAEPSETFSVNLVGATMGGNAIQASGSATITITDNDAPPPPPSGTNLLTNGSFEETTIPTGTRNFAAVPGWTALPGGRIEMWKDYNGATATDGTNLVELDYANAWDGFYQDVQTIAGQSHTLTFDLRQRAYRAASTQGVEILWNGTVVATTTPASTAWDSFTVSGLIGTGGLDRLTIREVQSQGGDASGALLDNFKLVEDGGSAASMLVAKTAIPQDYAATDAGIESFAPTLLASFGASTNESALKNTRAGYLYEPDLSRPMGRIRDKKGGIAKAMSRITGASGQAEKKRLLSSYMQGFTASTGSESAAFGESHFKSRL